MRMKWLESVARMGEKRKACMILVGKPEEKRPLWRNNITINLRVIRWGGTDCIDLAPDRDQWRALVNTVMSLQVPYNVGKFLSG
jgi:hypothetical protein